MNTSSPSLPSRGRVRLLLPLLAVGLAACSTAAPPQTEFQRAFGADITSRELRIRTTDFAQTFAQSVEYAADSILRLTGDRQVAKNALIWKTYAIPAVYRSATLPDPLMAWIDTRVLSYQMLEYFTAGLGSELFGPHQPVAIDAARLIEAELVRAREASGTRMNTELADGVVQFAHDHPLTNPYFFRPSAVEVLASYLGEDRLSALQAVGGMTELLEDMSQRLNIYAELLPRAGRWQAELLVAEMADPESAAMLLDVVNELEALRTLNEFLLDAPELVAAQREIVLEAVELQRTAFESELERYVTTAVADALAGARAEREAAFVDLDGVLDRRIGAAVTRVDGTIDKAVIGIDDALERAVDRLFVRLLQLAAIVVTALLLVIFLLRRRLLPARAE